MRSVSVISLLALLTVSTLFAAGRQSHSLHIRKFISIGESGVVKRDVNSDTISYGQWDSLIYYWEIPEPNGYGDHYYNVRFTPEYNRFSLVGAIVPLYDLGGVKGHPGMTVLVWQSGELAGEPGFPTDLIDSLNVPFNSLNFCSFDTVTGTLDYQENYIDLSKLGFGFGQNTDFHIGVNVIQGSDMDSLAILSDPGEAAYANDRSILWDGLNNVWVKIKDLEIDNNYTPYNFAIKAVVVDREGVTHILNPAQPAMISLSPCWPNPFNSQTRFRFSVSDGVGFSADLFDINGQHVKTLFSGFGSGERELTINGSGLSAGTYLMAITAGSDRRITKVLYIK